MKNSPPYFPTFPICAFQVGPGPVETSRLFAPEVSLYINPIRSLFDKQAVLQV